MSRRRSAAGKGGLKRDQSVSDEEFERRWAWVFGDDEDEDREEEAEETDG